jgi:hypothetical protein
MFNIVKRRDFMLGQDIPTWREAEEAAASRSARLPPNLRDLTHIAAKSTALVSCWKHRRLTCENSF